jgi:hypothetical protein
MATQSSIKKTFRSVSITAVIFVLLIGFQNCSEPQFSELEKAAVSPEIDNSVSLFFNKSYSDDDSNIDMIWIIDNSSSMSEETEIVRNNLVNFLSQVEARSNLNFAIISGTDSNYGVELSQEDYDKGYVQINKKTAIGKFLDDVKYYIPKLIANGSIRENSQKIIIMVGDDDFTTASGRTTNDEFMNLMSSYINLKDLTIHSFVGLDSNVSPCATRAGVRAAELASDTKGLTFNICEKDWYNHFKSILTNVARLAKTEFSLPSEPAYGLVVKVDGVKTDAYTVDGTSLILNPSNFTSEKDYAIQVEYIKKTSTEVSAN